MKRTFILSFSAIMLIATSCREHGVELMNPTTISYNLPSEQFEAIWHGINNGYAFWDIDPTNWDSLYTVYHPRFEALDTLVKNDESISTQTLREYYTDICGKFIDHHMRVTIKNIWSDTDDAKTNTIYIQPGLLEAQKRPYYRIPTTLTDSLLLNCIMNMDNKKGAFAGSDENGEYRSALACNFDGIAYFKLSGYILTEAFHASDSFSIRIQNVYRQFYEWCTADDLKGIIIDNRGNMGGYISDMNYVVAPFLQSDLQLGETRRKEGLGRYDYTPWVPLIIKKTKPLEDVDSIGEITVPIVALADLWSVSMGEMTSKAISMMPNGCIIGERTFGGHGPLFYDFEINYAGPYVAKSHEVYSSSDMLRDADGSITEGIGYTPTYEVLYDEEQMRAGVDVQLNAAINYIKTGKIE